VVSSEDDVEAGRALNLLRARALREAVPWAGVIACEGLPFQAIGIGPHPVTASSRED
jgi:hypothetical protein